MNRDRPIPYSLVELDAPIRLIPTGLFDPRARAFFSVRSHPHAYASGARAPRGQTPREAKRHACVVAQRGSR